MQTNKQNTIREEIIYQIHRELHARTSVPVEAPSRIRHTAYIFTQEDSKIRKGIENVYEKVVVDLGIKLSAIRREDRSCFVEKIFPDSSRLILIWEVHTEFYSYTTIYTPGQKIKKTFLESKVYNLPEFETVGKKLLDLDLLAVPELSLNNVTKSFLKEGNIYGGKVLGGEACVYTTFQTQETGQEQYVVLSGELSAGRLGRLIRRIIEIENYQHLVLFSLPEYRKQITYLRQQEKRIAKDSVKIASELASEHINAHTEHEWLVSLTRDLADLIQLTEKMRYRFSAAGSYYDIFLERLKWLREKTGEGYQSLEEFLTARVSPAVRNYRNFIERAEALSSQLTSLGNMMRTRINQNMEQQNQKTLEAMNKRVKLQLILQETVEGLSVIILSYYLTGLSGYAFSALEKFNLLPGGYKIWTALSIPIWIVLSFFISRRAKKIIKSHTSI
ncbi:MAG: DUF3422 domain-containing protein [Spirochaetia bacterium]|nr:DUF3422 domain-containing protein [Spirochaetia bacterium]